ncbi:MAG: hypothetical protein AAF196_00900 [Planctomycetota bacterium]
MPTNKLSFALSTLLAATTAFGSFAESEVPKGQEAVAPRARAIVAEISMAGEVILRGHTSDDGRPDVDAVWDRFDGLHLSPTDAFEKLNVPEDAEDFVLLGTQTGVDERSGRVQRARDVGFMIAYGGESRAFEVRIHRTTDRDGDPAWTVDPEVTEGYFSIRLISRREARLLDDPNRNR